MGLLLLIERSMVYTQIIKNRWQLAMKYFAWTRAERWSITAIITSNRRSLCIKKDMIETNFTNKTEKRFFLFIEGIESVHDSPMDDLPFHHCRLQFICFLLFSVSSLFSLSFRHIPIVEEPGPKRNPINSLEKAFEFVFIDWYQVWCNSRLFFHSWNKFIVTPIWATK